MTRVGRPLPRPRDLGRAAEVARHLGRAIVRPLPGVISLFPVATISLEGYDGSHYPFHTLAQRLSPLQNRQNTVYEIFRLSGKKLSITHNPVVAYETMIQRILCLAGHYITGASKNFLF